MAQAGISIGATSMKVAVVFLACAATILGATLPCVGQFQNERATLKAHQHWVICLAFSPDGKYLASGSRDDTLKLWDLSTGRQLRTIEGHSDFALRAAFTTDGRSVVIGGADERIKNRSAKYWGGMAKLFDVATGIDKMTFRGHRGTIISLTISPDGRLLATGDSLDGTIRLWSLVTGKCLAVLSGHTQREIRCLAFSPDSRVLASGSGDYSGQFGEIKLWEVASGKERATFMGHSCVVDCLLFSADGKTLASGSGDQTIRFWDVLAGQTKATLSAKNKESGYTECVMLLAFPSGTNMLVAGSFTTLKLWDLGANSARTLFERGESFIVSYAVNPTGDVVACGYWDGSIKLWDVPLPK
jgi:WD40 repeat protein